MRVLAVILAVFLGIPSGVMAQTARELEQKASEAIEVWKEVQQMEQRWAREREQLLRQLDDLELERQRLLWRKRKLQAYISNIKAEIEELRRRLEEMGRINRELEPFLDETWERLSSFILQDLPFLREERRRRLRALREVLDSHDVPVAEKLRRVLEALKIEVDYGSNVEVTEEELDLPAGRRTVQVLRLGRIALFYRTLDGEEVGRFNPQRGRWERIPQGFSREIERAMDMALKRRAAELIKLPVGRIAP
ncbi:MAG: hypothetical protein DRG33_06065 [Deltaproteobacteria bacterium]|nr:MAG: hypothetical protein DRG33_06065 [Deltaproteobacteria bacterium]HEX16165.1 DUF3450 domain-containing protein [Deltaproteobacteria bacterium]